jgi:hypothetical protein
MYYCAWCIQRAERIDGTRPSRHAPGLRTSAPDGADAAQPATMHTTWTTLQWTIE